MGDSLASCLDDFQLTKWRQNASLNTGEKKKSTMGCAIVSHLVLTISGEQNGGKMQKNGGEKGENVQ